MKMMTNSQIKMLVKVLHKAESFSYCKGEYEIKEYDVKELGCGLISVVLEVGRIKDEGTWAAILCRDRVHLYIGKRGGILYYGKQAKIKRLAPHESLWRIVSEQR